MYKNNVIMSEIEIPSIKLPKSAPTLSNERYMFRLEQVRKKMEERGLDCIVIYADREHYSNFKYLIGFEPRFEEGILVVHKSANSFIMLGNECFSMYKYSQIPVMPLLCQALSLPNQPMDKAIPIDKLFIEADISAGKKIGVIGWKLFTEKHGNNYAQMFDIPSFITESLKSIVGLKNMINCTDLMINPADGLRTISDADELACLEYGASWAANGVATLLKNISPGKSEQELAEYLITRGMQQTCHPMVLGGNNVDKGLISPSAYVVRRGDPFVTALGLEGGLSCRQGYIVESIDELPENLRGYIDDFVKPYYSAVASWYSTIGLGITGGEMYDLVNNIIPKNEFGWMYNPGHLIATDEWLSSPIYPGSAIKFRSGMTVQMDIIPNSDLYCGANAEDGIFIADEALREKISVKYPDMWERFQKRRKFMIEELGIRLKPEILPMSNIAGLYCPLLLRQNYGFKIAN